MKTKLLLCLVLILSGGWSGCSTNTPSQPAGLPLRYHNSQYDFTFYLPASWKSYSVLMEQWGPNQPDVMVPEQGPIIVLRHPLWKTNDLYQDIEIMVFTHKQWEEEHQNKFFPYAGGIITEIWHNNKYVFSLYSRYNAYDDVKDWKEADDIIATNCAAHTEPSIYDQ